MKIKWFGLSSFLITSDKGIRIITDPYKPDDMIHHAVINEPADIVTVTHDHFSHCYVDCITGNPIVYRGPEPEEIQGIKFTSTATVHGGERGGPNNVITFVVDGIRIGHLGDLGHLLSEEQVRQIGHVDIMMIPVDHKYSMPIDVAHQISKQLKAKITIPMHYKNDLVVFPEFATIDQFVKGQNTVVWLDSSEAEFDVKSLPSEPQIVVFKYAL